MVKGFKGYTINWINQQIGWQMDYRLIDRYNELKEDQRYINMYIIEESKERSNKYIDVSICTWIVCCMDGLNQ